MSGYFKAFPFEPMLCQNAEPLPEGREWRYELKLDGFRAIGRKAGVLHNSGRERNRGVAAKHA
jgi:ATP-dependent DNA ligase